MIFHPLKVLWVIIPFIVSIARDYRRFVFFGSPRILTDEECVKRAVDFTNHIASLGPAFIKAVQALGMREDIIPKIWTAEFKKLQDQVPFFKFSHVRKIIFAETGKTIETIFDTFCSEPIAAASLGQVHKAIYKNQSVAVKILRPNVEAMVSQDIRIIGFILAAVSLIFESHALNIMKTIYKEFSRMIKLEMDFSQEGKNAERFRENFMNEKFIIIPEIFHEISTKRMLVSKYYDGVRIDDTQNLESINLNKDELIANLIRIYSRQVIVDGFLHADPHPGNLLITQEGKLVMLDFGMVVEFEASAKIELLKLAIAAARRDLNGVVNGFYKLRMVDKDINMTILRDAANVLMDIHWTTDYQLHQIQQIGEDILKTFHRFPLRLPSNLVYLLRASALIEGLAISFNPKFNPIRVSTPIIKEIISEVYTEKKKSLKEKLTDKFLRAIEFIENLDKVINKAEREQLKVRAHEADIALVEDFVEKVFRRAMIGFAAIGISIFSLVFYIIERNALLMFLGFSIAYIILFLIIIIPIRKKID